MPFGRRYELERLKKNRRREHKPAAKFREVVQCGSPLPLSFRQRDARKIVHTSLPEKRRETGQSLAHRVLNPLVTS
jgi:hypothetical protein